MIADAIMTRGFLEGRGAPEQLKVTVIIYIQYKLHSDPFSTFYVLSQNYKRLEKSMKK